jgi:hypothetical protein
MPKTRIKILLRAYYASGYSIVIAGIGIAGAIRAEPSRGLLFALAWAASILGIAGSVVAMQQVIKLPMATWVRLDLALLPVYILFFETSTFPSAAIAGTTARLWSGVVLVATLCLLFLSAYTGRRSKPAPDTDEGNQS